MTTACGRFLRQTVAHYTESGNPEFVSWLLIRPNSYAATKCLAPRNETQVRCKADARTPQVRKQTIAFKSEQLVAET